jgi:hypothetical protein
MNLILNQKKVLIYFFAFLIPFLFFVNLDYNPTVSTLEKFDKFWGADSWRVNEILKNSNEKVHDRDNLHPFFSLFAGSISKIGSFLDVVDAEFIFYRVFFGTLGVFLFWLLIYRLSTYINAFATTCLLLSTMTVKVWSVFPETFLFSFFILMLVMNLIYEKKNPILVVFLSTCGSVTNIVLGFFYIFYFYKIKNFKTFLIKIPKLIYLIFFLLLLILFLSSIQKTLYGSPYVFNLFAFFTQMEYFEVKNLIIRVFDFLYSGFVIPFHENDIYLGLASSEQWLRFFDNYKSYEKRTFYMTIISLILITFCYIISILFSIKNKSTFLKLISYFIFFELLLHTFWGHDPFLFSFNFLPFLIIFISVNLFKCNSSIILLKNHRQQSSFQSSFQLLTPLIQVLMSICLVEANINKTNFLILLFS